MKNIFLDPESIKGERVYIFGEYFHYLKNVRRMEKGYRIPSVIGSKRYLLEVEEVGKDRIICKWVEVREAYKRAGVKLLVYQALVKPPVMDIIVSRLGELGVSDLIPVYTSRTVSNPVLGKNRVERWKRLAREGCKVSGFEKIMIIHEPIELDQALRRLQGSEKVLLFSTSGQSTHLKKVLEEFDFDEELTFHLFFGPEGGFSEQEMEKFIQAKAKPVTLGNFILRSETAALVGAGFIRVFYGEYLNEKGTDTGHTL